MWVCFHPAGKLLASGSQDGTVRAVGRWESPERWMLCGHDTKELGMSVWFSPDGSTLAIGCQDGMIRLWDLETAAFVQVLRSERPL